MRPYTLLIAAGITAAVAGCATTGVNVTQADIASFTVGQSTEPQVIARLGEPSSASTGPDGTKTDLYIYARSTANAASYVPVIGLLAGGTTSKSSTATFVFDAHGILRSTASGVGHSNMNTGLLNQ